MLQRVVRQIGKRAGLGVLLAAAFVVWSACAGASTVITSTTPTASAPPGATATSPAPTATSATSIPVLVYFSKHPDSDNNVNAVFAVNRVSSTLGVGTFVIQQLIAGPTAAEASAGYYTELTAALSGPSNCGGPDFQYSINNSTHTGTLKFCRTTSLAGDLTGARIQAEITKSLTQFPNVTKVIILNSTGHCFNDLSGQDLCLH